MMDKSQAENRRLEPGDVFLLALEHAHGDAAGGIARARRPLLLAVREAGEPRRQRHRRRAGELGRALVGLLGGPTPSCLLRNAKH